MDQERFSPTGEPASTGDAPSLDAGESVVAEADGVVLGWQPRTILIWWLPGVVFAALAWLETRSLVVTIALVLFCAGLFLFYSFDREVRPRSRRRRYVLTQRRLLIASAGGAADWRPVDLGDIAVTRMEEGAADRAVRRLSGAATIVLQLRSAGPKGEPRTIRIGPMRSPEVFRRSIDAQLARAGTEPPRRPQPLTT